MNLEIYCSQTLNCSQTLILGLEIAGGASISIFPRIEELLSTTHLRDALSQVTDGLDPNCYRSFMDLMLCSLCPELIPLCRKFYLEKGPPLREMIDSEGVSKMEILLLATIEAALIAYRKRHNLSWPSIRFLLSIALDNTKTQIGYF